MLLKALNLQKSFGKTHVLKGISLEVKEGEVIAILVPPVLANPPYFVV